MYQHDVGTSGHPANWPYANFTLRAITRSSNVAGLGNTYTSLSSLVNLCFLDIWRHSKPDPRVILQLLVKIVVPIL